MKSPAIISDPAAITGAWLTEVLQHAGHDAEVTGFTARSIGTGQVGENVRFTLEGRGDLPATLVGKFPSMDPVSRQTGIDTGNYRREVHFYRHIRPRVNIQTPRVLFAEVNDETHEFVLVMEDLAPGEQGDQLGGCDEHRAGLAMTQLAHLHGPVWNDTSLLDGDLIVNRRDGAGNMKLLWDTLAPGFIQRYSDRLSTDEKAMVRLVGDNIESYINGYQGQQTLVHIDYRLDNMMFGGPYPLAVVDWQSPAVDCGLIDAAYFMGTSIVRARRAALEDDLLRRYHETLTGYGVDLSWEACWHYYRHYAPAGLIMAVIASMIVGETERGNDMFMAMARRSVRMCEELDTISALAG